MMQNATIKLLRPATIPTTADALQRDHLEVAEWEGRARLGKATARMEATVFGQAVIASWQCKFVAPLDVCRVVTGGWRVQAILDGDSAWHDYNVQRSGWSPGKSFVALDLERVG